MLTVTRVEYHRGLSYARGTTIDAYISPEACEALYQIWKPEWPEKLEFPGKVYAITAEMILEVPEAEFLAAFRKERKQKLGQEIRKAAQKYA